VRRLASVLRGEVPAAELEGLRAAGRGVYQVYLEAEQLQVELAGAGTHPLLASTGQRTQLLCTWNAYVLQVLGEALIDGDYRASPITGATSHRPPSSRPGPASCRSSPGWRAVAARRTTRRTTWLTT